MKALARPFRISGVTLDRLGTGEAHPARRYDYWLGGRDNFAADRESGDLLATSYPAARIAARAFQRHAVGYLTALEILDLTKPVALILVAVVRTLLDALPSGSHLVMTLATTDLLTPELTANRDESLRSGRSDVHPRTRTQVAEFVVGLELIEPGISAISEWRPDPADEEQPTPIEASLFGLVARKP